MIIPNLLSEKLVDEKGHMSANWRLFFGQLITAMQNNLSNEGFILPQQSTENILKLTSNTGGIIYNSQTHKAMVNENGVFKTITTS